MKYKEISPSEFKALWESFKDKICIVDVREPSEYEMIRVKDSMLIPLAQLAFEQDKIEWEKDVILICRSGNRSAQGAMILSSLGKKVTNLEGGISGLAEEFPEILESAG
jgi:rhodanese-related sulfurtransferase